MVFDKQASGVLCGGVEGVFSFFKRRVLESLLFCCTAAGLVGGKGCVVVVRVEGGRWGFVRVLVVKRGSGFVQGDPLVVFTTSFLVGAALENVRRTCSALAKLQPSRAIRVLLLRAETALDTQKFESYVQTCFTSSRCLVTTIGGITLLGTVPRLARRTLRS
jgi:hypothetical protein